MRKLWESFRGELKGGARELNQHREILQRVNEANAEEEVRAYEKNIKEAETQLAQAKNRREMFEA